MSVCVSNLYEFTTQKYTSSVQVVEYIWNESIYLKFYVPVCVSSLFELSFSDNSWNDHKKNMLEIENLCA